MKFALEQRCVNPQISVEKASGKRCRLPCPIGLILVAVTKQKCPKSKDGLWDVRQRHRDAKRVAWAESVTEYAAAYSAALFACDPRWFAR